MLASGFAGAVAGVARPSREVVGVGPVAEFVNSAQASAVVVRTPDASVLTAALQSQGAQVEAGDDGALVVRGLTVDAVGDLAFDRGVRLHELSTRVATLEEAFLERTAGSEEFQAAGGGAA